MNAEYNKKLVADMYVEGSKRMNIFEKNAYYMKWLPDERFQ